MTTATVRHILENPVYTGYIVHRGEWIEAEIDALVTREAWDLVQQERLRRLPKRDPETDFLIGILHDDQGRRMKMLRSGPGRTNHARYYRSEAAGWSRGTEHKNVLVNADQVEGLFRAVLTGFLRDRRALKDAVFADSLYSDEICKLLRRGNAAARCLECMDASQFRQALVALVPRAEVTRSDLRLLVSCGELKRFLGWDGTGRFARSPAQPKHDAQRCYVVTSPACLIRGHHRHILPIGRRDDNGPTPRPDLVELIKRAVEARDAVFANRDKSVSDLAVERRMTESRFARLVRINYLAPDIQTAILDGTEPVGLCQQKILNAAMLLDWKQQREMLGFVGS